MEKGGKASKQPPKSENSKGSMPLGNKEDTKDGTHIAITPNLASEGTGELLTNQNNDAQEVDQDTLELHKKVDMQEQEIDKLRQMLDVVSSAQAQNVREAKIIELFKKNQALSKSFEHKQSLSTRLKGQINLIKEELLRRKEERKTIDGKDFPRKKTLKQVHEVLQWKEKFNQVNAKLLEIQGAKSMLSAEVGRLQHALQCEVGEHIPLSKVLEDGGGWKGRGQQICLLKDKIIELKGKIQLSSLEDFQRSQIEAREMIQKQRLESLVADFLATRRDLCDVKQKLGGVLARRNILASEIKGVKERMALLVSKSDNDNRLISVLRIEIEAYKESMDADQLKQKVGCPIQFGSLHAEHQLAASFNDLKKHCEQQELQIRAQAELIEYLRAITGCESNKDGHEVHGMKERSSLGLPEP